VILKEKLNGMNRAINSLTEVNRAAMQMKAGNAATVAGGSAKRIVCGSSN
jgi:hypothetical protein